MRSYLFRLFLFLFASALFSCHSPSESVKIEFPELQTFDTLNVEATLKLFSTFENEQRDTLFFALISKLEKQNKINLLEKYIKLYTSNYSTNDIKTLKALNKLCYFFLQSSAYDSVDKYSNSIIDLASKLNDAKQLGQAELLKGVSHFYRGNYEQSYELFSSSIKYFEQAQDSGGLMSARTNMAQYYIRSKKPDKAIQEYLLNEKYFTQKNDSVDLSDIYMMLSDAYRIKNDIDSSDYYINKAYAIVKVLGNSYNLSICNNNIAINQIRKGNTSEALLRLKENLAMIYEKKVVAEYAPTLNNIGLAYNRNNDFNNAELYFKKCIQVLDSLKQLDMKLVPIGYLSSLNEKKGDYKEALYWYKQSVNLKDSLDKISNQENINELNIRFETNLK